MPVTSEDLDGMMTIPEVAERLHVAEITVKRMVRDDEIEFLRIGSGRGRIFITQRALLDYLNRSKSSRGA